MALTRYHFSLGNSSKGPIGYCASVKARTKERALEILKAALPEAFEMDLYVDNIGLKNGEELEYANAYFNTEVITVADIDEEDPCDDDAT